MKYRSASLTNYLCKYAIAVIPLGLFSGEWSTTSFRSKARLCHLTIPMFIPLLSQNTGFSVLRLVSCSFHCIRFAITLETLLLKNMNTFLLYSISKLKSYLSYCFFAHVQMKGLFYLMNGNIRLLLHHSANGCFILLC